MNKKGNSPKRENCERDCRIILQLREELRLLREQLEESVKLHSEFVRSTDQEVIEKVLTHYLHENTHKSMLKRENIRMVLNEILDSADMVRSEVLKALLAAYDDEVPAVMNIGRQEVYHSGSTKNENCRQLNVLPDEHSDGKPEE